MTTICAERLFSKSLAATRLPARLPNNTRDAARKLAIRASNSIVERFRLSGKAAVGPVDVVDIFCGCGGMSCGFEHVGRLLPSFTLAGAVDWDEHCCATFGANLPVSPIKEDLFAATSSTARLKRLFSRTARRSTAPLVLVGGPPCQGFSAHQKKNGHGPDRRNDLVKAFTRCVEFLDPDFVVMENVPELLAKRFWGHFEFLRETFRACGYQVRAQIHNLAGFGVPQERFRALVIASKKPFAMPKPFLGPDQFRSVRDTIGSLPPVLPGELTSADSMHYCTKHKASTIATIREVPKDGGRRPPHVGPRCLRDVDGFRDVYGRMYWDRPANTITASSRNPASGRYVHPQQDRGLTIREAALLQSFPRSFVFEGPFDHRFLQIGNAVPPAFAASLAAHIFGELTSESAPDDSEDLAPDIVSPVSNSFSSGIAGRKKGAANGGK